MNQTSPESGDRPAARSPRSTAAGRIEQANTKDPLPWLLDRQHGVISRRQAESIGLTASTIRHRIRPGGPWQRMLPGVYLTVTGSATVDQKEVAALLYAGRYSTITGLAALRRYGLAVPSNWFTDVLVPTSCGRVDRDYIRLHRTNRVPARVAESAYIQIALIPRAAVDAAMCMTSMRDIRALIAGLVQQGRCSVEQLEAEVGQGKLRSTASLRSVLAEVAGGARSSPEADLMNLIRASGLPTPLYNPSLYIGKEFLASPDLWWKERGVAAEVDSREWHISPEAWEGTMSRHDRMVAAGIRVLHFTPRKIRAEPGEVVSLIRSALRTGTPLPGIRTVPAATRAGRTD